MSITDISSKRSMPSSSSNEDKLICSRSELHTHSQGNLMKFNRLLPTSAPKLLHNPFCWKKDSRKISSKLFSRCHFRALAGMNMGFSAIFAILTNEFSFLRNIFHLAFFKVLCKAFINAQRSALLYIRKRWKKKFISTSLFELLQSSSHFPLEIN